MPLFQGEVVRGYQKARISGYPTANVKLEQTTEMLVDGVYAALVHYKQAVLPAALIVGVEPEKIEIHLLDWSGDLYGQEVAFQIVQRVNDIEHAIQEPEMIKKIERDIEKIRQVLK